MHIDLLSLTYAVYNALLNGVVFLTLFFAALCEKSDKNTESVAAIGYGRMLTTAIEL